MRSPRGIPKGFKPNWAFNADANTGHAFGIFMACVGTLRAARCALRAPAPVNLGVIPIEARKPTTSAVHLLVLIEVQPSKRQQQLQAY